MDVQALRSIRSLNGVTMLPNAPPISKLTLTVGWGNHPVSMVKRCHLLGSVIQTSPVSTSASHQAGGRLVHWKTQKPLMKPSTNNKLQRGSIASREDIKDYESKIFDEKSMWQFGGMSDSDMGELAKLGFRTLELGRLSDDVAVRAHWGLNVAAVLDRLAGHVKPETLEYPVPVPARVLRLLGIHYVEHAPEWRILGLDMLTVASAMQDREASIYLCMYEHSGHNNFQASNSAHKVVADLAATGTDWRAMSVHVRDLVQAQRRSKAMALATKIASMTQSRPARKEASAWLERFPLPWKTLVEALDYKDYEGIDRAYEYGAVEWDDPEACAFYARSNLVELGSQHWLKYITKAAMAGRTKSMEQLGLYYLAFHGWYPKQMQPSKTYDSRMGFQWLELAATFCEEPYRAAEIWSGLALLCREHGDKPMGMKYLQAGITELEKTAPTIGETDNKDSKNSKNSKESKGEGLRLLRKLVQQWGNQYIVDVVDRKEQICSSETFLGTPITPIPG